MWSYALLRALAEATDPVGAQLLGGRLPSLRTLFDALEFGSTPDPEDVMALAVLLAEAVGAKMPKTRTFLMQYTSGATRVSKIQKALGITGALAKDEKALVEGMRAAIRGWFGRRYTALAPMYSAVWGELA